MLGGLRLLLALCVVFAHVGALPSHLHTGIYAVFGFYVLSGFLVTGILNGTYRGRPVEFITNRTLKIFPAYFLVALITIPAITFLPVGSYHQAWAATPSRYDVIANLFVVPLAWSNQTDFRLVPPSWSVGVELINYGLLFALVGRRWWLAAAAFAVSLSYHIHAVVIGADWSARYFPVAAAVLPFSMGALIFFSRNLVSDLAARWLARIGGAIWLANLFMMDTSTADGQAVAFGVGFYANLLSLGLLIAGLGRLPRNKLDDYLGDLSYPIFLLHWLIGFLIVSAFGFPQGRGLLVFTLALLPLVSSAVLLNTILEATVNPIRSRIRLKSQNADLSTSNTLQSASQ